MLLINNRPNFLSILVLTLKKLDNTIIVILLTIVKYKTINYSILINQFEFATL